MNGDFPYTICNQQRARFTAHEIFVLESNRHIRSVVVAAAAAVSWFQRPSEQTNNQNIVLLLIQRMANDEKGVCDSGSAAAAAAPQHKQLSSFLNVTVMLFNKHRFQWRAASVWRILKLLCGKRRGKEIRSVIRSLQSARSHTLL